VIPGGIVPGVDGLHHMTMAVVGVLENTGTPYVLVCINRYGVPVFPQIKILTASFRILTGGSSPFVFS
jgi:hypothetical protein